MWPWGHPARVVPPFTVRRTRSWRALRPAVLFPGKAGLGEHPAWLSVRELRPAGPHGLSGQVAAQALILHVPSPELRRRRARLVTFPGTETQPGGGGSPGRDVPAALTAAESRSTPTLL